MEKLWNVTSKIRLLLWVELCPPSKRYIKVLTPGTGAAFENSVFAYVIK